MSDLNRLTLRIAGTLAMALTIAGCAARYDAMGNRIYVWQHGQGSETAIDYSNPRLPVLPRSRPIEPLWQIPSPYEFNDLSRYSFLTPPSPLTSSIAGVSDNAACASPCDSIAPRAPDVFRADAGRVSVAALVR